jgi:hypothetical protein
MKFRESLRSPNSGLPTSSFFSLLLYARNDAVDVGCWAADQEHRSSNENFYDPQRLCMWVCHCEGGTTEAIPPVSQLRSSVFQLPSPAFIANKCFIFAAF